MMLTHSGVIDIGIVLLKFRVALDGQVRLMGPDGQEKRLIWITLILQPKGGLIRDQRS